MEVNLKLIKTSNPKQCGNVIFKIVMLREDFFINLTTVNLRRLEIGIFPLSFFYLQFFMDQNEMEFSIKSNKILFFLFIENVCQEIK